MKKSRRLAQAFWNRFKKRPLPPSWDFTKELPHVEGGGFDKLLKRGKVEKEPESKPKKYERKRIKLSTIAMRRKYGKYTG